MNRLFVSFELARILKELGFNEPCVAIFNMGNELSLDDGFYKQEFYHKDTVLAPLLQQVTDWLRDEHGIIIVIIPFLMEDNSITYEYTNYTNKDQDEIDHGDGPYEDYYDALNAAIKSALSCI